MLCHNRIVVLTNRAYRYSSIIGRIYKYQYCSSVSSSVADPHHIDADLDSNPAFYFDANPDPYLTFHSDSDPDPSFQFDSDPDSTTNFSPDLDAPVLQDYPPML
jgi:hypothetical protein